MVWSSFWNFIQNNLKLLQTSKFANLFILMWMTYENKVTWHSTAKKFKSKNGNSLCLRSFKFVTFRLVKMVLCSAFVKQVLVQILNAATRLW